MRYLGGGEKIATGFGAYVPDLPGCVAVGDSREEVRRLIQEAVELHLDDLKESGQPIPPPSTESELIQIDAA